MSVTVTVVQERSIDGVQCTVTLRSLIAPYSVEPVCTIEVQTDGGHLFNPHAIPPQIWDAAIFEARRALDGAAQKARA